MQPQNPPPNLPTPSQKRSQTPVGKLTETLLQNIWEPLDLLGKGLMGDLWRTVYLSIQDAIALGVLVKVPNLVGQLLIGKSFTSFDICLKENPLGSEFYACFIIVAADFLLWIVLAGRIIGRFWADMSNLQKHKGGDKDDSQ